MNQQVISFAIPNGHVDSPIGFRLTPEVRARILWLLAGPWAAFCSLRTILENQKHGEPKNHGSFTKLVGLRYQNPFNPF